MRLLDKYILKQLIVGFLIVLIGLTMLVWLTQSLKMIDMIVTKGVSARLFLKMTFLALPFFIQILSPLALFAIILFVYNRMHSDKELIVMQTSGMDVFEMMKPALLLAVGLVIIGYLFTLYLIPKSYTELKEMKWQIKNNLSHLLLQEGQFNSFQKGITVYIKERFDDGSVKGVIVYDNKNPKKIVLMVAKKGIIFQKDENIHLLFQEGVRKELDLNTQKFSILQFDDYTMTFDTKEKNSSERVSDVREQSLWTLLNGTQKSENSMPRYRRMKVEAFKRLTQPLYNLTFMFLASFAVLFGFYDRKGQVKQVNIIVFIALLIQSASLLFENMTNRNLLFFPLMFANIVIPILFVFLFFRKKGLFNKQKSMLLLFLGVLFSAPAFSEPQFNFENPDKNSPVNFEADSVQYDKETEKLIALGNVIVKQGKMTLTTDEIVYNRKINQIYCPKEALLSSEDGTTLETDGMTLSGNLKEGIGKAMIIRFIDGTLITANSFKRKKEGERTVFRQVSYTPCFFCEGESPLWELTAKKIIHNSPERTMLYQNSLLKIKSIPIFYFPYLEVPDFAVKRKTGLLTPSFAHSSVMGSGIKLPLFVDLAPNQNLLITPMITPSHFPLTVIDYNSLFKKAAVDIQTSFTQEEEDRKKEGHIKARFSYDLNKNWRLYGNLFRVSDDTYFRRYTISGIDDRQSFLTSDLNLERFGTRNYLAVKALSFQSLQDRISSKKVPYALPLVKYYYQTNNFQETSLYGFSEIDSAFLRDRVDFYSNRISLTQGLRMPYIAKNGLGLDTILTLRADGYNISSGNDGYENIQKNRKYDTGLLSPNISTLINYPLASSTGQVTQIFEPIVMLVYSETTQNSYKIPNLDSRDFDFDDTNLFVRNRFSGYDRIETGTRINYGVKWSLYDTQERSISTLFGQVYQFNKDSNLNDLMGIDKHFSDYVGRIQVDYKNVGVAYRFRLDEETLKAMKNEFGIFGGNEIFRLGVDYTYIREINNQNYSYPTREEINLYGSWQFHKNWRFNTNYRYNLIKDGGPIEIGSLLRYDNECLGVEFELYKSYAKDRNYKGDTSFMVKFILKTLGGV